MPNLDGTGPFANGAIGRRKGTCQQTDINQQIEYSETIEDKLSSMENNTQRRFCNDFGYRYRDCRRGQCKNPSFYNKYEIKEDKE